MTKQLTQEQIDILNKITIDVTLNFGELQLLTQTVGNLPITSGATNLHMKLAHILKTNGDRALATTEKTNEVIDVAEEVTKNNK